MKLVQLFLPIKKRYNIIFFILFGLLTLFISFGIFNIELDNDVTVLLPVNPETEHEREKINRLNKEFPSDQPIFIGIKGEPFSIDKIESLWKMWCEIEALDSVRVTISPFNATYFQKFNNNFTISRMNSKYYPKTDDELYKFVENISSNRSLVGSIISKDKKTAGIIVKMNYDAMIGKVIENKSGAIKFIEKIFGKDFGPKKISRTEFCIDVEKILNKYEDVFEIYLAGVPVYEAKTKIYLQRDMFALLIPAIFLMIFTLFLNIRTNRGTILPILLMLLSLVWTMGIIGWIRYKLNTVGILLPPIILTIGSSYTLHYLYSYYTDSALYDNSRDIVINSSKHIFPTIFMASLTTAIGFASFLSASIKPVKMFGLFAVLSIVFTVGFTFFLLSKILSLLPVPKNLRLEKVKNDIFSKILRAFSSLVYPFRFLWLIIYGVVIVLFVIFIPNLKVETNPANFFRSGDKVRKSLIYFQDNFDGTSFFNVTIRSIENKKNFFKTRDGMLTAQKIQKYIDNDVIIDGYTTIGWNISPVTLVEDLNYTINGVYDIPEDESILKRFLTFLKISGDDSIKSIINENFSAITFQIRTKTNNNSEMNLMTEQELAKLEVKLKNDLGKICEEDGSITVEVWGEIMLLSKISKYLINDQIKNIISTVIFVFIAALILFRSPYFSFFCLIPLSFGVIMNFTIMSIFKIPLDAATIMIAAIAFVVGIDDSIHFILNYKALLKKGLMTKDAVIKTLEITSRPILFTSIALTLGFIVFFLSSFKPIFYFGLLIAISMVTCTFSTMFVLPSFLIITDKLRFKYKNQKKNQE